MQLLVFFFDSIEILFIFFIYNTVLDTFKYYSHDFFFFFYVKSLTTMGIILDINIWQNNIKIINNN
jgi:hypothetical protein